MSEQLDHRAAIEWAVENATNYGSPTTNAARHILHSVKAAWPGVVPEDVKRFPGDSRWGPIYPGDSRDFVWPDLANKFERDYPGLKVDDPWLVTVMEGVK